VGRVSIILEKCLKLGKGFSIFLEETHRFWKRSKDLRRIRGTWGKFYGYGESFKNCGRAREEFEKFRKGPKGSGRVQKTWERFKSL
jgi:hypothetical protein